MPGFTKIQWSDVTWNPVTGCTKVSAGCDHCYAETFAERWRGVPGHHYEQGFDLKLWPSRIDWPIASHTRWQLCFVNSMSDLFHVGVPDDFRLRIFRSMRRAVVNGRHFQVLTKRADGMERWMRRLTWWGDLGCGDPQPKLNPVGVTGFGNADPLENVWLGVSVEDQAAVARARHLIRTPAFVRFLSVEPMLGPIDLRRELAAVDDSIGRVVRGRVGPAIDWVIIGGESGPDARPMELEWVRDVIAQCRAVAVPVFVKQLGAVWARRYRSRSRKGEIVEEWDEDLRIHQWPVGFHRRSDIV